MRCRMMCRGHSAARGGQHELKGAHPGCDEASWQCWPHMDTVHAQDPLQGPLLHEALPPGAPLLCWLKEEEHCARKLSFSCLQQPGRCSSKEKLRPHKIMRGYESECMAPGAPLLPRLKQEEYCSWEICLSGLQQPGRCSTKENIWPSFNHAWL